MPKKTAARKTAGPSLQLPLISPRRRYRGQLGSIMVPALDDVELLVRTFAGNAINQPVLA